MANLKNHPTPILGQILQKIAPSIGAKVLLEPEWGIVGQIEFANGKKRYFRYSSIDMNTIGASDIAKDKDYANFFMQHMGYPTVPGKPFFSKKWGQAIGRPNQTLEAAYVYAQEIGFPVIVKPNSGSQGVCVAKVHNKKEFVSAMNAIFKRDRVALVQPALKGKDYRVVVLDNKVISAYERIPLHVIGDGVSSILTLLKEKQTQFIASSRDTRLHLDDPRIKLKLQKQKKTFTSIPVKGEKIFLLDNANLSAGGTSVDITKSIHPDFAEIAIKLTKDMGLRLCGVDLMIQGSITEKPSTFWILEINAAPGLDHYARSGAEQEQIVENLYLEILKNMEKE